MSTGRPARKLLGLTSALLALQVLNLAVFDDLRTDPLVGAVETFTKPQHLSSIVAVLLAVVLVALRHRARLAWLWSWRGSRSSHSRSSTASPWRSVRPSRTGATAWETHCSGGLPVDLGLQRSHRRRRPAFVAGGHRTSHRGLVDMTRWRRRQAHRHDIGGVTKESSPSPVSPASAEAPTSPVTL